MAGRTRTLQQLVDAVADRADVAYATSGVRHTTAQLITRINAAIQRWKTLVADAGDDTDMTITRVSTSASSTRDANNVAPRMYVLAPSNLMRIRGIDIYPTVDKPLAMLSSDELERADAFRFRSWWAQGGTGLPVLYKLGGTAVAGPIIQIFPWADAVYTVDIRFIPNWTDLDSSGLATSIDFILGGDEWVVNDAAIQTMIRDGQGMSQNAQACRGWNDQLQQKMQFELACRNPINKVDTRERRREMLTRLNLWRYG